MQSPWSMSWGEKASWRPRITGAFLRRRGTAIVAAAALAVPAAVLMAPAAFAVNVALPGSNFEIDSDANLKLDGVAPAIDWGTVNEQRQTDKPTGQTDDSYKGGVKEDTSCPDEVTGSIRAGLAPGIVVLRQMTWGS